MIVIMVITLAMNHMIYLINYVFYYLYSYYVGVTLCHVIRKH